MISFKFGRSGSSCPRWAIGRVGFVVRGSVNVGVLLARVIRFGVVASITFRGGREASRVRVMRRVAGSRFLFEGQRRARKLDACGRGVVSQPSRGILETRRAEPAPSARPGNFSRAQNRFSRWTLGSSVGRGKLSGAGALGEHHESFGQTGFGPVACHRSSSGETREWFEVMMERQPRAMLTVLMVRARRSTRIAFLGIAALRPPQGSVRVVALGTGQTRISLTGRSRGAWGRGSCRSIRCEPRRCRARTCSFW
jgi:hypothetical protein